MLKTRATVILLGLFAAVPAAAQVPSITRVPLLADQKRFSIEDVGPDSEFPSIRMQWSASHSAFTAYEAELTYVAARDDQNPDQERVTVEQGELADEAFIASSETGRTYSVYMLPSQIVPAADIPDEDGNGGINNGNINIVIRVGRAGDLSDLNNASDIWSFEYDTKAPGQPEIVETVIGENRVRVSWTRAPEDQIEDVFQYEVVYCPSVTAEIQTMIETASTTVDWSVLPCPEAEWVVSTSGNTVTDLFVEEELVNGQMAAFAVRGVDDFGNIGKLSDFVLQQPAAVTDFYELYREEGGTEDGGYCFVATAAYGSYAHPAVRVFRSFRDSVLHATPFGRALIWAYYQSAPPLAAGLTDRPLLAGLARVLLILMALLVAGLMLAPFAIMGGFAVGYLKRHHAAAAVAVLALGVALPSVAQASRPESALESVGLALEFEAGPYLPAIGNADAANSAFGQLFGTNSGMLFKLGSEVQVYRGFGTVAVGGSIGYQSFSGNGRYEDESVSADVTRLSLLPLSLVGVYRFDYLAEQSWFPLVPYVKAGLAYTLWWSTNGRGDISRIEGAGPDGGDLIARGGKLGVTGTLGVSLLLNALERHAATALYNSTSIRGTYLYAEVESTRVDGFWDEGFDLSDLGWNVGLMLEF